MFIIGKSSVKAQRICRIAQECLYIGIEKVKPGIHLGEIGKAIGAHGAESERSLVVTVQPSSLEVATSNPPRLIIGSMVKVMPASRTGLKNIVTQVLKKLRNYFIAGLLFWIPLGLSIVLIKFFLE
jgi:methionine aminopeptidase